MSSTPSPFWSTFSNRLAAARWLLLILAAAISAALFIPASRLALDESIESFYSPRDPFVQAYRESRRLFGGDEFVLVGYPCENATKSSELKKLEEFSHELSEAPGVRAESTQDLASTLRNRRATGIVRIALRLPAMQRALVDLSRRVLISDDGKTQAIVLRLANESDAPRKETFAAIRELAAKHDPPALVAGEPVQVHDMFRAVEDDGRTLGLASSSLLMLVILVFFRNLRWVLLPLVVIHITLLWTRGILYLSGLQLSMVSSMLTSLITIIGIATVMHVTVTYREHRATRSRYESYQLTVARLSGPIFWTCLTTGIGFASLLSSSITPVRSFGVMMTVGTALVPLVCLMILPGGILIGARQADPQKPWGEARFIRSLQGVARWSLDHSRGILIGGGLMAAVAAGGLFRLRVETDFSKNFREDSPIVTALHFFETRLGGVGSWEVAFPAPPELDDETLDQVRALASELRALKLPNGAQLTKVVALTDGLDMIPKIPLNEERRGLLGMLRLKTPTLDERREMLASLQPEMEPTLYNPEAGRMRIVLRALEQQPAEVKLALISEVERLARARFPEARATGLYVLLANLISSLLSDQLVSFGLAATGVCLSMALAFRSLAVGLLSIIPNVLPILLVVGGLGWSGSPVNIGTAMIASVSMGLTVDSTIHYLAAYRRSRRDGADHRAAAEAAHGSVGLALLLANVALVAGFSVLSLSHFMPLVYFGVLVSVAMLGGLIGNLLLLPVLLRKINFT